MASSTAYDIASSDDEMEESSSSTTCNSIFKHHRGYPVERKVIDPAGRLGSLYDSSTHRLIDRHSVRPSETKRPSESYICHLVSGESSRGIDDVLVNIGFNETMLRSIRSQIVQSSGIAYIAQNNQPINRNTRFLYYAYRHQQQKVSVNARKADKIVRPPNGSTKANYMITKIIWGFEFLYMIQIPPKHVERVDELLQFIRKRLKKNNIPIRLNDEARQLLRQLNNSMSYGSETCINNIHVPLLDVLNQIEDWQQNTDLHRPLVYVTQPLRWLFNSSQFPESCSEVKDSDAHIAQANGKLRRIDNQLKEIDEILYNFPATFPSAILNRRLKEFRRHYEMLLDTQEDLQKHVQESMQNIRRHRVKPTILDTVITDLRYQPLFEEGIKQFRFDIERLANKGRLINQLKQDRIEYINAFDVGSHERSTLTNEAIDVHLKRTFSREKGRIVMWYSGDRLRREQADKWKQIYEKLTSERQQAAQRMRLPDIQRSDFIHERPSSTRAKSASSSPINPRRPQRVLEETRPFPLQPVPPPALPREKVEPLPARPPPLSVRDANTDPVPTSPSRNASAESKVLPARDHSPRTEINVLLLGETGVGKSTFINAFVNYLKFATLEEAEGGEPVVLIPVSFLITLGDNFDEFIVKYGDVDANEDHEHQGQSVTQHCKSYIFELNNRVSLRLIDTPGIGDTRGIAQDVKNIDHILTYINTLPHLNAVCLLLKPNASRLTVFFRSCINQLLTYLTPIGYENIIFCFTNARATFYSPGDTGRLLREMLVQEHLTDIPFKKANTFCFDSESFRYLAARRSRIKFDDYQKVECQNSWTTSVKESFRLLNFIKSRQPYRLQEYQSPRKVVLDITMYARALMETLRLIIYNWKITEAKLVFNQMILTSKPVDVEICTHCAQANLQEVGRFWITQYQPPAIKNASEHRQCPPMQNHFLVEAVVQHQFASEGAGLQVERWQKSFHEFLFKCDRIHHFLRQQGPSPQDDPFGSIIERFLEDEQQISQIRNIDTRMNEHVREILQSIRRIRQRNSQQLFAENERLSVRNVYRILDELMGIQTVQKLIESIKQSRIAILKTTEQRISANIIQNQTFL